MGVTFFIGISKTFNGAAVSSLQDGSHIPKRRLTNNCLQTKNLHCNSYSNKVVLE